MEVVGCTLTASSLARGINTPGTAGVRDSQFLNVYIDIPGMKLSDILIVMDRVTSLVTSSQCYDSIL